MCFVFFFFNDTATTEIYTLSLHDALPISLHPDRRRRSDAREGRVREDRQAELSAHTPFSGVGRSEEHTSELQSQFHLVCRLLLEKKKKKTSHNTNKCHTIDSNHKSRRP